MTSNDSRPDGLARQLERARTLAAGVLAGGVVHEFANLLTVVDGMRQMEMIAPETPTRAGILSGPSERCQSLVESFRHLFSHRGATPPAGPVVQDLDCFHSMLKIHLRGCPTRIEVDGAATEARLLDGGTGVLLRPAFLCGLLGVIEGGRVQGRVPELIRIGGLGTEDQGHGFVADFGAPVRTDAASDPSLAELLLGATSELTESAGGRLITPNGTGQGRLSVELET